MAELNYCRFDNLHTAVHVFTNQKMCRIAYSLCKVFLIIPAELIYYQYASYHWIGTLLSWTWDRAVSAAIDSILYHNHNQNMDS